MSFITNITLPQLNSSAEKHCYQNPHDIRKMIMNYWLGNISSFKKPYKETLYFISQNSGIVARIKRWFGWMPPDLEPHIKYVQAMKELIDLYETRKRFLFSEEFINNITGTCPICIEPMQCQPIVIPDCLHPVCTGCFVNLFRGYGTYQCPMRCHIIKFIYPLIIYKK